MSRRWTFLAMAFILCLALFLRTDNLSHAPPGLSRDEAMNALDAFHVADRTGFPFYEEPNRPEPLFRLIQGVGVLFFGHRVFALRLVSALVGVLTVAAAYRAVVEALNGQAESIRRLAGVAAAAALTVALSHITLSRTLYRAVPQPLFTLLAVAMLLRGIRTQRNLPFLAAAVSLSLAVYSYTAALVLPGLLLPLGLWLLLFQWLPAWRKGQCAWYAVPSLKGFVILLLALLLILAPVWLLLMTKPDAVLGRANAVSAGFGDPVRLPAMLVQRLLRAWRMWAVTGDANPQYNVASAPLLPLGTYPLFLLGLVMCLLWIRQPASWLIAPLVFLSMMPVALSDEIPHGLRITGAFAALPMAIGYGIGGLLVGVRWLTRFRPAEWNSAALKGGFAALAFLLLAGGTMLGALRARSVYADYWSRTDVTWRVHGQELSPGEWFFLAGIRDFAIWVNAQDEPVYIPVSAADLPTLRAYLAEKHPRVVAASPDIGLPPGIIAAPHRIESQDWDRADRQFVLLNDGQLTVLPPFDDASHQTLLRLMEAGGPVVRPNGAVSGYSGRLSEPTGLAFEKVREPLVPGMVFDEAMALVGWSLGEERSSIPHLTPDSQVSITLYWQKATDGRVGHEYLDFVQIWTQEGQGVSGMDTTLMRWLYPPTAWREGETIPQLVQMDLPPELSPGAYQLVARVYPRLGAATPAMTADGVPLGTEPRVGWLKVPQSKPSSPAGAVQPLEIALGADIVLRGVALTTRDDQVLVELHWQPMRVPEADATIFVHAVDAEGRIVAQQDTRPWNGQYPTFIWDEGELVVTEHKLTVPSSVRPITLYAGAYTFPGPVNLPAIDASGPLPDGRARVGVLLP